jgi:hypothetical protein
MKALALLWLMLLVGCAHDVTGRARYSYTFSFLGAEADHPAFTAAVAAWNQCGVVQVTEDTSGVWVRPVDGFPWNPKLRGLTEIRHGEPVEITYTTGDIMQEMFEHELGHALTGSVEHTATGLMAARIPDGAVVDQKACDLL